MESRVIYFSLFRVFCCFFRIKYLDSYVLEGEILVYKKFRRENGIEIMSFFCFRYMVFFIFSTFRYMVLFMLIIESIFFYRRMLNVFYRYKFRRYLVFIVNFSGKKEKSVMYVYSFSCY